MCTSLKVHVEVKLWDACLGYMLGWGLTLVLVFMNWIGNFLERKHPGCDGYKCASPTLLAASHMQTECILSEKETVICLFQVTCNDSSKSVWDLIIFHTKVG